jgi:hypothetical protein
VRSATARAAPTGRGTRVRARMRERGERCGSAQRPRIQAADRDEDPEAEQGEENVASRKTREQQPSQAAVAPWRSRGLA